MQPGRFEHQLGGPDPVRAIGSHHPGIGIRQLALGRWPHCLPFVVQDEPTALDLGQVAVLCVIRNVVLEKHDNMPVARQRADQRPPQDGMAVAPGGADRKTKNDELHRGGDTFNRDGVSVASSPENAAIDPELHAASRAAALRGRDGATTSST